jgi:hypothetical protein
VRRFAFSVTSFILLAVHALLVVIGVGGLVEWFDHDPPWPRFSNPELPPWMLMLQWLLMLGAGVLFIAGFLARWRRLPWAMFGIYAVMAAVCAHQTFTMLTNHDRYTDMAIEYAEYTAILLILFFLPPMRRWFKTANQKTE